jgi:hypothetical protein
VINTDDFVGMYFSLFAAILCRIVIATFRLRSNLHPDHRSQTNGAASLKTSLDAADEQKTSVR